VWEEGATADMWGKIAFGCEGGVKMRTCLPSNFQLLSGKAYYLWRYYERQVVFG